jgi:hypothetical protein
VKLGLKGNGLGWSFKPKKAAMSGPSKLASKARLPSSSQQPLAEESKLAVEVQLGASDAKISVPEREMGESPPLSMLPACEVCVGKSDGDGPSMGEPIPLAGALEVPPVSALEIPVVDFPLGTDRDEAIVGCPAEDGSLIDSELTSPVSTQAKVVRNPAQAMGLLRRGFLGPRSPSPALSSLGCKAAPMNGSVSSPIPKVSQVGSSPLAASMSMSQVVYSRRVKEKVAKQLHKNKELLAEAVVDIQVGAKGYSKAALDVMKFAPLVGMTWGGEDNKLLDMVSDLDTRKATFEVSTPKVRGIRELKNLDCTVSPVKGQRRQGFLGSNNDFFFPPEVQ